MGTTTARKNATIVQQTPTVAGYRFFAIADGLRLPLRVEAICGSDAEASLVAISLATGIIGVEVWRRGALLYRAPRRRKPRATRLRADTVVDGTA